MVERSAHSVKEASVERDTHWDWEVLCEAVLCLSYAAAPPVPAIESQAADRVAPAERFAQCHDFSHDSCAQNTEFADVSLWRRRESKTL